MGEGSIDRMGWLSKVIIFWVHMLEVCIRCLVASWYSMIVKREHLGESVSHFEFTVEGSVELSIWIETAIFMSSLCSWRLLIVHILVWQVNLKLVFLINLNRRHFPQVSSVVVECPRLTGIDESHMLERSASLHLLNLAH